MKIRVLCSKEELKKTDEIQEALNRAMKPLTDLGLKGETTIEEIQDSKNAKELCPQESLNLTKNIPPLLLSTYANNAGFGIEYWLQREYTGTKHLLQDGVYFCAVLDLGEDYNNPTPANVGACEAVKYLATQIEATKLKELITEARETKTELMRLIEGNFTYPEQAISIEKARKMQRFFNKTGAPFLRQAGQYLTRRRRG